MGPFVRTLGFLLPQYQANASAFTLGTCAGRAFVTSWPQTRAFVVDLHKITYDATAIVACPMSPLNLFVACANTWILRAEYDRFSCPLSLEPTHSLEKPLSPLARGFVKIASLLLHSNRPSLELALSISSRSSAPHFDITVSW